jgi:uncharacterized protein (DUF934 family)
MRPILKRLDVGSPGERREIFQDDWKYFGEEGSATGSPDTVSGDAGGLIVPLADLQSHRSYPGRLGVRLAPGDQVDNPGIDFKRLSLVAVEFPSAGEGRGFSQGRLLRSARFGFKGELRAIGAGVKQDLLFIMARCGFDAFELAPGQKVEEALRAFERYTVAYQPAQPLASILQQRLFAAG